ncbi:DNA helicase RecG, partial [candidate division KSB1 bacterium]
MNWYRQSIRYLQGIGEKRAVALEKAGISFVEDLLTYFPRKYLDRAQISKIRQLRIGQNATVVGQVVDFRLFPGRRRRFVLRLADETGELNCVWFHGANYMKNVFQIGEVLAVHGKVRFFRGYQISH